MSDWMGPWIPDGWKLRTIEFIRAHPQYIFQTLTKQPQELPKWEFPENCHVGVTATGRQMFMDAVWELQDIKASIKYLSIEPLLSWEIGTVETSPQYYADWMRRAGINWLIIGSCTGTLNELKPLLADTSYLPLSLKQYGNNWTVQPKIEWVQNIVEAADKAGVPVFLKENLKPLIDRTFPRPYSYILLDEAKVSLRQEWPK